VEFIPKSMLDAKHYGLHIHIFPELEDQASKVEDEIQAFQTWETNIIQLDRAGPYARKVQVTTSPLHVSRIKAYLGFVVEAYSRNVEDLSITTYLEAPIFLAFISFLMERKVAKGHMLHHISVANKIVAFIKAKSKDGPQIQHCTRLTTWINVSRRIYD
jgi:hypothetical protein